MSDQAEAPAAAPNPPLAHVSFTRDELMSLMSAYGAMMAIRTDDPQQFAILKTYIRTTDKKLHNDVTRKLTDAVTLAWPDAPVRTVDRSGDPFMVKPPIYSGKPV